MMGYCFRCERRWVAKAECHCDNCCNHFKSESAFMKHREGPGDNRICLDIEEMLAKGMVYDQDTRKWVGSVMPDRFKITSP